MKGTCNPHLYVNAWYCGVSLSINISVLRPALMPFESRFADIKWKLVGQQDMYNYVGVMNNYFDKACIKRSFGVDAGCISVRF